MNPCQCQSDLFLPCNAGIIIGYQLHLDTVAVFSPLSLRQVVVWILSSVLEYSLYISQAQKGKIITQLSTISFVSYPWFYMGESSLIIETLDGETLLNMITEQTLPLRYPNAYKLGSQSWHSRHLAVMKIAPVIFSSISLKRQGNCSWHHGCFSSCYSFNWCTMLITSLEAKLSETKCFSTEFACQLEGDGKPHLRDHGNSALGEQFTHRFPN